MNLRHAAPLTLVVWYLVYPGPRFNGVWYTMGNLAETREPEPALMGICSETRETLNCESPFPHPGQVTCIHHGGKLDCQSPPGGQTVTCTLSGRQLDCQSQSGFQNLFETWRKIKRYDNERDCKTELETHGLSAKCMASDDPRLNALNGRSKARSESFFIF
jgi:hypothetical protein